MATAQCIGTKRSTHGRHVFPSRKPRSCGPECPGPLCPLWRGLAQPGVACGKRYGSRTRRSALHPLQRPELLLRHSRGLALHPDHPFRHPGRCPGRPRHWRSALLQCLDSHPLLVCHGRHHTGLLGAICHAGHSPCLRLPLCAVRRHHVAGRTRAHRQDRLHCRTRRTRCGRICFPGTTSAYRAPRPSQLLRKLRKVRHGAGRQEGKLGLVPQPLCHQLRAPLPHELPEPARRRRLRHDPEPGTRLRGLRQDHGCNARAGGLGRACESPFPQWAALSGRWKCRGKGPCHGKRHGQVRGRKPGRPCQVLSKGRRSGSETGIRPHGGAAECHARGFSGAGCKGRLVACGLLLLGARQDGSGQRGGHAGQDHGHAREPCGTCNS